MALQAGNGPHGTPGRDDTVGTDNLEGESGRCAHIPGGKAIIIWGRSEQMTGSNEMTDSNEMV